MAIFTSTHRHFLGKAFSIALMVTGVGGIFLFFLLRGVPDPSQFSEQQVTQSTKIYDRTGATILYDIHGEEKRTVIQFEKIPVTMREATIAIEDSGFYQHPGIDIRGIIRALFIDIKNRGLQQGGSTITQQLVKNSLLKPDRSLLRKVREAVIAMVLESKYSKDQILGFYLNQIPYGQNAYGVEAAAETYFEKSAQNLTLAESALLASLPKAPSYYSPYGAHLDELLKRKNLVLDRMAKLSYVTQDEADAAKKDSLALKQRKGNILAPHFVAYIREYLASTYGESFVEQGGLKVTTTLNWDLQQKAEDIVRRGAERNDSIIKAKNAALAAMDPKTGEILAMVGSRGYFLDALPIGCTPGVTCQFDPQVNVTLRARQPGSSFKPFVYATAFDKGYTDQTVLFDVPTEFNTVCNTDGTAPAGVDPKTCYSPGNYDERFRGPVTARQALAQSLNVPSVELLYLAGVEDSIKTASRLGITTIAYDPKRYGLALVLGGAEVTLLDMVHAYGAFATEGMQTAMTGILKVEDSNGNILENHTPVSEQVLNPEVARTVNDILSDNDARQPVFAPQSSLYFSDRPVAAKTGTTQDYHDAWTIGYTPSLVAGVWVGNNDNTPIQQKGSGVLAAAPIWHEFMQTALRDTPVEQFTKPQPVVVDKPILRGLWQGGTLVTIDKVSGQLATSQTPKDQVTAVATGDPHTILYWISKDNPRGPVPTNPASDPEFSHWESALQTWLSGHPYSRISVPTSYDTIHTETNRPKITITSPAAGDIAKQGDALVVKFSVQAAYPIQTVTIAGNNVVLKTLPGSGNSFDIRLPAKNISDGDFVLDIRALDKVGNQGEASVTLFITK